MTQTALPKWMHNGGIADFHKMKRKLQQSVQEDVFNWVTGNTGTYHEL